MTLEQYIKKIEQKERALIKAQTKALFLASQNTHAEMSERIFSKGENIYGNTFQYSQKPAIIGDTNSPKKFMPKKVSKKSKVYKFQPFKTLSKNGKKGYFGRYFAGGYKEFKSFVGRKNDKVNFNLTGELKLDFNNGSKPTPIKISEFEYRVAFNRLRNVQLKRNLDTKYSQVFSISNKEAKNFIDYFKKEVLLILKA